MVITRVRIARSVRVLVNGNYFTFNRGQRTYMRFFSQRSRDDPNPAVVLINSINCDKAMRFIQRPFNCELFNFSTTTIGANFGRENDCVTLVNGDVAPINRRRSGKSDRHDSDNA